MQDPDAALPLRLPWNIASKKAHYILTETRPGVGTVREPASLENHTFLLHGLIKRSSI